MNNFLVKSVKMESVYNKIVFPKKKNPLSRKRKYNITHLTTTSRKRRCAQGIGGPSFYLLQLPTGAVAADPISEDATGKF